MSSYTHELNQVQEALYLVKFIKFKSQGKDLNSAYGVILIAVHRKSKNLTEAIERYSA